MASVRFAGSMPAVEEEVKLGEIWKKNLIEETYRELDDYLLPEFFELDFNITTHSLLYLFKRNFNFAKLRDGKYSRLLFQLFKFDIPGARMLQWKEHRNGLRFRRFFMSLVVNEMRELTDEQALFIIQFMQNCSFLLYLYELTNDTKAELDSKLIKLYVSSQKNSLILEPFLSYLSEEYKNCLLLLHPGCPFSFERPSQEDYKDLLYDDEEKQSLYFQLSFGNFFDRNRIPAKEKFRGEETPVERDVQEIDADIFSNLFLSDDGNETG